MQTFLPYRDFSKTAKCLDYRRLGKQRVEVLQILKALNNESGGWINHPAVKMWRGYESALVEYGIEICREWKRRGYKDTCMGKIKSYRNGKVKYPSWLGGYKFHNSHKSNLTRKFPEHYGKLWPNVSDDLEYVWPTKMGA